MKLLSEMKGYNFDNKHSADEYGNVYFNVDSKNYKSKAGDKAKSFINKYGYVEYILSDKDNKRKHIQAHRIVASLYLCNEENKKYVNHIDGNKLNNHHSNLEWVTASENEKHSYHILKKNVWNKGISLPSNKDYKGIIRPVASYSKDGILVKEYFNPKEASYDGFCLKQISSCCLGRQKTHKGFIWKYLEK